MKKDVQVKHKTLIKKFFEKQTNVFVTPFSCEPTKN
jgi:hypothetical protein